MFSAYHLSLDVQKIQRLAYVYVAMIKDSSIEKEDRHLVMQSLFSRADTGLLKEDPSPTMPRTGELLDAFKNSLTIKTTFKAIYKHTNKHTNKIIQLIIK